MKPNPWLIKLVLLITVLTMTGVPAMAQAAGQQQSGTVDPSAGPKTPQGTAPEQAPDAQQQDEQAPSQNGSLPAAPSATQQTTQQPAAQNPDGTAAAERGRTVGGPASKPAGMAIAPAKQKSSRGLLIKLGALAAAGVAVGTVYALTRATSSTPPNSGAVTNH